MELLWLPSPPPAPRLHLRRDSAYNGDADNSQISLAKGSSMRSLQELRQPLKSFGVTHALRDAHHEQFDWAGCCGSLFELFAIGHVVEELQASTQLVLRGSHRDVDLVAQHN